MLLICTGKYEVENDWPGALVPAATVGSLKGTGEYARAFVLDLPVVLDICARKYDVEEDWPGALVPAVMAGSSKGTGEYAQVLALDPLVVLILATTAGGIMTARSFRGDPSPCRRICSLQLEV